MEKHLFTSESVTEGHPDKLCDAVSDAILDACIAQDPMSRVACETACCTGFVLVTGEITTKANLDVQAIVRQTVNEIGYSDSRVGFDGNTCAVMVALDKQSPDIAMGVDKALEARESRMSDEQIEAIGAGDQGMMFGYACDETPELMPAPISMAHRLSRRLAEVRKSGQLPFLRPDGKTQVTVKYDEEGHVECCPAIVVSSQHSPEISIDKLREAIVETVIKPVVPAKFITGDTKLFVNPTGRFVVGGPVGDSGLTGRKIIVDTYGGVGGHGGGCFSGKDPSKVDRSGAYMARYIAKNIVGAGLARRCQIETAYAIGVARPVSIHVDTMGTGVMSDERLAAVVGELFDLRPAKIIERLGLLAPIYFKTAAYGHFGRTDVDLPWEKLDMVDALREYK